MNLQRQIEVEIANGKTTPQAGKEAEITVQSYYRWRKEYGGLKLDQAKRLKELERENAKLKPAAEGPSRKRIGTLSFMSPSTLVQPSPVSDCRGLPLTHYATCPPCLHAQLYARGSLQSPRSSG